MIHRILAVASMALFLAGCAEQVTLDPGGDGDPLPVLIGVSVSPEEPVLVLGGQETVQLTAEVTGVGSFDERVTWTSDTLSVATVTQSGLVTAVDDGIATVTATSVFDPAGSGSTTIRVQRAVVVKDVTPAVSANLVPIDTVLTATFNVAMDPGTIDDTTFTLRVGTVPVAGIVGYDDAARTATFTPDAPLALDTVYEAAISPEVRSASGGTLEGAAVPVRFAWSFWTVLDTGTGPGASIGGIDVTPATSTVTVGDSRQLTATPTGVVGDPDVSVTWSSSASSVATVSTSGLVSAVGVGTATITARSVFDATVSGSAQITVEAAPVLRFSYPDSPYEYLAGAAFTIDPVVEHATGTLSFSWVPVHDSSESNWSIDESTGRISRTTAGGRNNFTPERNGNRTYVVTVRDGPVGGPMAAFEVEFIDVSPD